MLAAKVKILKQTSNLRGNRYDINLLGRGK